jgi:DNA polymerase elongation subunit (family B)
MQFYTSVVKHGSTLLVRGFDENGAREQKRVKFKPTLYLPSKQSDTKWKGLDGTPVEPRTFDSIADASDFMKSYADIDDFNIFGNDRWVPAFTQSLWPNKIPYDSRLINVVCLDIETAYEDGYSEALDASNEILSIALKSSRSNRYHVWGTKDFDITRTKYDVEYHHFRDEESMLRSFVLWWMEGENTPDVITGWNVELFDMPYLINRITRLFGLATAQKLSPWNRIDEKKTVIKGSEEVSYAIAGITVLDYLALFQKFTVSTYGAQETYKLEYIAGVVLDESKVDYTDEGSLQNLYEVDHQKFIEYNIADVELVMGMDGKLKLLELVYVLAYMGGVNYSDTLGTTAIWDAIIYRRIMLDNVVPPQPKRSIARAFAGGYVKEVVPGTHEWVMSFDLNSLYPSIIMQYNMSPETISSDVMVTGITVDSILNGEEFQLPSGDYAVAANGCCFSRKKRGFIPTIIEELYAQRVEIKSKMLSAKKRLQIIADKESSEHAGLSSEIAQLETSQLALKVALNSLYGAQGNAYFRYYDIRIAEGITLTGQLVAQWAAKTLNGLLDKDVGRKADRVAAADTDSAYVVCSELVRKAGTSSPVDFLDRYAKERIEPTLEKSFAALSNITNAYTNKMVMKREAICDRAIWVAAKNYILNIHDQEGVRFTEPKIKVTGIKVMKASSPRICREMFKEIFPVLMKGTEDELRLLVDRFRSKFKDTDVEKIAFPVGVSDMVKYADRKTIYKVKGTPMHVRAALLHNHHVKAAGLHGKYPLIKSGDRIKHVILRLPNPVKEGVFGFKDRFPRELKNLPDYIDYDAQFDKAVMVPLNRILSAAGWSIDDRGSIADFFV